MKSLPVAFRSTAIQSAFIEKPPVKMERPVRSNRDSVRDSRLLRLIEDRGTSRRKSASADRRSILSLLKLRRANQQGNQFGNVRCYRGVLCYGLRNSFQVIAHWCVRRSRRERVYRL